MQIASRKSVPGVLGAAGAVLAAVAAAMGWETAVVGLALFVALTFVVDSFLGKSDASKATEGQRRPELPAPFWRHLDHDAVTKYRMEYQSFRLGKAQGAEGEASELPLLRTNNAVSRMQLSRFEGSALFAVGNEDGQSAFGDVYEEVEETQRLVNEWRLAYRQHRQGAAKGAKGDIQAITDRLNAEEFDLLPTRKLIILRQQLKKKRDAGAPEKERPKGIHLHFGAGKLGLGLIIPPLVESGESFALVQRSSSSVKAILEGSADTIKLLQNGEQYSSLKLARNLDELPDWSQATASEPMRYLVLNDDDDVVSKLMESSNSISTSLGPVGIAALGETLARVLPKKAKGEELPALFAGENDHKAVDKMAGVVEGRVQVIHCMVDRICVGRTITEDAIDVSTEPFVGTIVVNPPEENHMEGGPHRTTPQPPLKGEHILLPELPAQGEYLCRRKIVTVNGMHTTLAFMALCQDRDRADQLQLKQDMLQAPEKDVPLVTLKNATDQQRADIMAWCVARQILLIFEFDAELMMLVHDVPMDKPEEERNVMLCEILWKYARECAERFSETDDTCGRVLGGGVENRFRTRLNPVADFLKKTQRLSRPARAMLKVAGITASQMREAVGRLTDAASSVVHGVLKQAEEAASEQTGMGKRAS